MFDSIRKRIFRQMDALRRRFAQTEGLPFSEVLSDETVRNIIEEEISSYRNRIFPPIVTLCAFINDLRNVPIDEVMQVEIEKLLHEYDTLVTKRLERTSLVARVGPMLGLMGTLIPMGPALAGLAQGDVELLANNMIIAFGTTVLGLLVGGGSYAISTVRSRWYDRDIDDMRYICDMIYGDSDVS